MDRTNSRTAFAQAFDEDERAEEAVDMPEPEQVEMAMQLLEENGEPEPERAMEGGEEPSTPEPSEADGRADPALEMQRLRSWEGRLRAREAQLKEREAQAAAPQEAKMSESDTLDGEAATAAVEQAVEAVAAGQPVDDALAALEDDFGADFVAALNQLVEAKIGGAVDQRMNRLVDDRVGRVHADVEAIVGAIRNDRQREHYEFLAERHPDFIELSEDAALQSWVDAQGGDARKIVESGTARQVSALLDKFKKAHHKQPDAEPEPEPDHSNSAVAVRGRAAGLRLPAKPAAADDFMSAWEEA